MPFELISTPVHPEMLSAAEDIVEGIREGHITGLGLVVTTRDRRFFVDAFGALTRDPHGARGWVASLDDCLREIAASKYGTRTTKM